MYVIFPLEELLDIRSTVTGPKSSQPSGSDQQRLAPGQLQQKALPGPQQPAQVPARPPVARSPTPPQPGPQPATYNILQSQQRAGKAAHSQSPSISSSGSPGAAPSTVPSSSNSGSSSQGSQAQIPKGRGQPLRKVQVQVPAPAATSTRGQSVKGPQPQVGVVGLPAGPPGPVVAAPDSSSIIASPGGGTRNLLTPPAVLPGRTPPPERANRSSWAGSPTASSDGGVEGQKGTTVGRSSSFRRDSGPESQGSGAESNKPVRQNSFRSIRDAANLPVRTQTVADRKRLEDLREKKAAVALARSNPPAGVDSKRSSESEPTYERADSTTTIIEKSEKRNNSTLENQPQATETNQNFENKNNESVIPKVEIQESGGLTKVSVELSDSVVSEEVNPLGAVVTVVPPHSIVTPLQPKALRGDNYPPPLGGAPSSSSSTGSRPSVVSRRNQAYLTLPRKYPQRSSAMAGEVTLKDLTNPAYIEPVKAHNNVTFKLVKTGDDEDSKDETELASEQEFDESLAHRRKST